MTRPVEEEKPAPVATAEEWAAMNSVNRNFTFRERTAFLVGYRMAKKHWKTQLDALKKLDDPPAAAACRACGLLENARRHDRSSGFYSHSFIPPAAAKETCAKCGHERLGKYCVVRSVCGCKCWRVAPPSSAAPAAKETCFCGAPKQTVGGHKWDQARGCGSLPLNDYYYEDDGFTLKHPAPAAKARRWTLHREGEVFHDPALCPNAWRGPVDRKPAGWDETTNCAAGEVVEASALAKAEAELMAWEAAVRTQQRGIENLLAALGRADQRRTR